MVNTPSDVDGSSPRGRLDRARILRAALGLADRDGVSGLTMRKVGRELGVEAMSLYRHVSNKDDLLDGLVDLVIGEIELPRIGSPWRPEMQTRARNAWQVLQRHPWALALLESRSHPGARTLRYYDAVIGCLRADGFSVAMAAHAFSALDSYVYGFAMQHQKLPFETSEELEQLAAAILGSIPEDEYPHFRELTETHVLQPGYDFADEFEFGLDLVLDGLERQIENG